MASVYSGDMASRETDSLLEKGGYNGSSNLEYGDGQEIVTGGSRIARIKEGKLPAMGAEKGVPRGVVILVVVFLDLFAVGMAMPLVTPLIKELGASPLQVGFLSSTYGAVQLVTGPFFGLLSDSMGRRVVILVSYAGAGASYLLLGQSSTVTMVVISRVLLGITKHSMNAVKAYVADHTTAGNRAVELGRMATASALGIMVGPAVGGMLFKLPFHSSFLLLPSLPPAFSSPPPSPNPLLPCIPLLLPCIPLLLPCIPLLLPCIPLLLPCIPLLLPCIPLLLPCIPLLLLASPCSSLASPCSSLASPCSSLASPCSSLASPCSSLASPCSSLHPLAPPLHPLAPPLHPLAPPLHPLAPPLHPLAPPLHPLAPPLHPLAPPLHPLAPPLHPLAPPCIPLLLPCIPLLLPCIPLLLPCIPLLLLASPCSSLASPCSSLASPCSSLASPCSSLASPCSSLASPCSSLASPCSSLASPCSSLASPCSSLHPLAPPCISLLLPQAGNYPLPTAAAALLYAINSFITVTQLQAQKPSAESTPHASKRTARVLSMRGLLPNVAILTRPRVAALMVVRAVLGLAVHLFRQGFSLLLIYRLNLPVHTNGLLLSLQGLLTSLVQGLAIRPLLRRFPETPLIFRGLLLLSLTLALLAAAPSLSFLVLLLPPLALSTGVLRTTYTALLTTSVAQSEVGQLLGLSDAIMSACRVLGPSAAGLLSSEFGYHAPVAVSAAVAAIAALLFHLLVLRRHQPASVATGILSKGHLA
ncbi:unnamed protein product [Closterium sp. Yama58-4]|nr:unnamed protein product [Closterium sp. Yama58-4]